MNKKQENETIQSVLNGDREKFALLVDKYKGPVYNLVYRLTGSRHDAEDLAQETFLTAYKSLNSFKTKKKFFPWLYTIAINQTRNHLKKKRPLLVENVEDIKSDNRQSDKYNPEINLIKHEQAQALASSIKRLPIALREAVILRYYFYLPFEEIARILIISLSGAKMRVYRGLEKLEILMNKKAK
ncbi:MAG: sigma-70 family RNA polymerase sigma factor [Thermodesulfobacteriota bacterium]|nr:sigma-70 family RNA polymerase sigma factor [Thermodesulfobacteriota bacterium]